MASENQIKDVGNAPEVDINDKNDVFANPKSLYEATKFDDANDGHGILLVKPKKMTTPSDSSLRSDSGIYSTSSRSIKPIQKNSKQF